MLKNAVRHHKHKIIAIGDLNPKVQMMTMEADSKEENIPEIRVLIYGVGSIGSRIVRLLLKKRGLKIVGAIDASPEKIGKDLGQVAGVERELGIIVSEDSDDLLSDVNAKVAIHATSSFLRDVYPQITRLITHGMNVISTCEELSYPHIVDETLASQLDDLARRYGVTVLGTGINPGFLMDTLPIVLSAACQEIRHIRVERVIDASKRRLPFQKKIGVGLPPDEFKSMISKGRITGHVGLRQSIAMIAEALKLDLEGIVEEKVKPIIADRTVESHGVKVDEGRVLGLMQVAHGIVNGENFITLIFKAFVGADEYDSIRIDGVPEINQRISPCIHGDLATAAIIVNSIPKVINAPPGLKTMKDLQLPSALLSDIRSYLNA